MCVSFSGNVEGAAVCIESSGKTSKICLHWRNGGFSRRARKGKIDRK